MVVIKHPCVRYANCYMCVYSIALFYVISIPTTSLSSVSLSRWMCSLRVNPGWWLYVLWPSWYSYYFVTDLFCCVYCSSCCHLHNKTVWIVVDHMCKFIGVSIGFRLQSWWYPSCPVVSQRSYKITVYNSARKLILGCQEKPTFVTKLHKRYGCLNDPASWHTFVTS